MTAGEARTLALDRTHRFFVSHVLPIGLGIVGCAFGIVAVKLAYKSLEESRLASSWARYTYDLAIIEARMSLMSLCAQTPEVDNVTCAEVRTWEYLLSALKVLRPQGGPPVGR
ncbi:hypothetical protein BZA05DRAFT_433961 [Tricharina praecox]|uniref:uncharacterized protein n=1 Tax=Tricharina praecox TaxID=43433 RepID=UPI00221EF969|nr:uncharacterized protein BZA05DRAFT_433961 [Tricharina praecox]KAI5856351.1 hypothetical protein BZA05DRAFT_433961 [Tricharina praecox]